ncbi:MAG TPA: bis(5'-nucleosyl)-tetraphosphatase (symmetrical) YqeK [Candidatus Wallbacteria bacterium]|nr:bis(5'-nucleosyl)-tetraphosphatase (symmetrical) YqeK [Candidatus Wallbacteria bacterium]
MNDKQYLTLRKNIIKYLQNSLGERLFLHCLGVEAAAVQIAAASANYSLIKRCSIAALMHDAAKGLSLLEMKSAVKRAGYKLSSGVLEKEGLLHGHASACIALETFNISDRPVITAVRHHTLGRLKMSVLEKIIFISDYIEPGRRFAGIEELRSSVYRAIFNDCLDRALLLVVRDKIRTLEAMGVSIEKILFGINDSLSIALENGPAYARGGQPS